DFATLTNVANSIVFSAQAVQWPKVERLYPEPNQWSQIHSTGDSNGTVGQEVQEYSVQAKNTAGVNFILPFSGKARITQTGDDGDSHNCEPVGDDSRLGDCQALDFVLATHTLPGEGSRTDVGK